MKKDLVKKLSQAEAIIQEVLRDLGRAEVPFREEIPHPKPKTLGDHIMKLRDDGFFSEPRTAEETHAALQEIYHCEKKRVVVELIRLSKPKRRQLRKTKKKYESKELIAYVW